ncbi:MAG: hypothetical protein JWP57_393 [Spirosoma sp.]|nr:hypothetical protein [Spirosoma sp.]
MTETIFHINQDGTLDELKEMSYNSEELLQGLLSDYPKLLAGEQINSENPRNWLLVSREFGVPDTESSSNRWYLDHLFLDQDAVPTLVEVKRSTDTRIRREVIGQILDYAANAVVYWKVEELISCFEATCKLKNLDPINEISNLIGISESIDNFWNRVNVNLKVGKLRLILVADIIPNEMKRIIEFLNGQMSPAEIIGIEIKQFVGQQTRTLVPKVVGQTSFSQSVKSVKTQNQISRDEVSYFEEMLKYSGPDKVKIARQIFDWAKEKNYTIDFGKGMLGLGSFIPYKSQNFSSKRLGIMPFAVWVKGSIEIYFQHYQNRPPFDSASMKLELLNRLNQIKGLNIPESAINRRPSFSLELLKEKYNYDIFVETFNWFDEHYL